MMERTLTQSYVGGVQPMTEASQFSKRGIDCTGVVETSNRECVKHLLGNGIVEDADYDITDQHTEAEFTKSLQCYNRTELGKARLSTDKGKQQSELCSTWACAYGTFPNIIIQRSRSSSFKADEAANDKPDMFNIGHEKTGSSLNLNGHSTVIPSDSHCIGKTYSQNHSCVESPISDAKSVNPSSEKRSSKTCGKGNRRDGKRDELEPGPGNRYRDSMHSVTQTGSKLESNSCQQYLKHNIPPHIDSSDHLIHTDNIIHNRDIHQSFAFRKDLLFSESKLISQSIHNQSTEHGAETDRVNSNNHTNRSRSYNNKHSVLSKKHPHKTGEQHQDTKDKIVKHLHKRKHKTSNSISRHHQSKHLKSHNSSSKHNRRKKCKSNQIAYSSQEFNPQDKEFLEYCFNKYYRLRGTRWETSSTHALTLLKKKYRSLRILFSKEPILMLKKTPIRNIFEAMQDMASDKDEQTDTAGKDQYEEAASLVDPRVMSLSRALESGRNGQVGIEKTFKSVHVKSAKLKIQHCSDKKVKKPKWTIKPDLSKNKSPKLKPKLGSWASNSAQPISKDKHLKFPNKCSQETALETGTPLSDSIPKCNAIHSTSVTQEKKRRIESNITNTLKGPAHNSDKASDNISDISNHSSKPANNSSTRVGLADNIVDNTQVQDSSDESVPVNLDANEENSVDVCNINEYQIEICRDSSIGGEMEFKHLEETTNDMQVSEEDNAKETNCSDELNKSDDLLNQNVADEEELIKENISDRGSDALSNDIRLPTSVNQLPVVIDAALTVTSDIIPNLYNIAEEFNPVINQADLSPPILKREFEEDLDESGKSKGIASQNGKHDNEEPNLNEDMDITYEPIETEEVADIFVGDNEDFIIYQVNLLGDITEHTENEVENDHNVLDLSVKTGESSLVIESTCSINSTPLTDNEDNVFQENPGNHVSGNTAIDTDANKLENTTVTVVEDDLVNETSEHISTKEADTEDSQTNNEVLEEIYDCSDEQFDSDSTFAYSDDLERSVDSPESGTLPTLPMTLSNSNIKANKSKDRLKMHSQFQPFKLKKSHKLRKPSAESVKLIDKANDKPKKEIHTPKGEVKIETEKDDIQLSTEATKTDSENISNQINVNSKVERKESISGLKTEADRDERTSNTKVKDKCVDSENISKNEGDEIDKGSAEHFNGVKSPKVKRRKMSDLQSLEDDAEELPKIQPPKRRPRSHGSSSYEKKALDMTDERLMQDFPKHNWLFNKYSTMSGGEDKDSSPSINTKTPPDMASTDNKPATKVSQGLNKSTVKTSENISPKVKDSVMTKTTIATSIHKTSESDSTLSKGTYLNMPRLTSVTSANNSEIDCSAMKCKPSKCNEKEHISSDFVNISSMASSKADHTTKTDKVINDKEVSSGSLPLAIPVCSSLQSTDSQSRFNYSCHNSVVTSNSHQVLDLELSVAMDTNNDQGHGSTKGTTDKPKSDNTSGKDESCLECTELSSGEEKNTGTNKEGQEVNSQVKVTQELLEGTDKEQPEKEMTQTSSFSEGKNPQEMDRPPDTGVKTQAEPAGSAVGKAMPLDLCVVKSEMLNVSFQKRTNLPVQLVHPHIHKPPSSSFTSAPITTHTCLGSATHISPAGAIQMTASSIVRSDTPIPNHATSSNIAATSSSTVVTVSNSGVKTIASSFQCRTEVSCHGGGYREINQADLTPNTQPVSCFEDQIHDSTMPYTGMPLVKRALISSTPTSAHDKLVGELPKSVNCEVVIHENISSQSDDIITESKGKSEIVSCSDITYKPERTSVPALVKASNHSHGFASNTGMVIPVQPIIQPLSLPSPRTQVQFVGNNLSNQIVCASAHTDSENQISRVSASQGPELMCTDSMMALSPQLNQSSVMYQSQPQIIQVQPQTYSSTQVRVLTSPRNQSPCRKIYPKPQVPITQNSSMQAPTLMSVQSSQAVSFSSVSDHSIVTPSSSSAATQSTQMIPGNLFLHSQSGVQISNSISLADSSLPKDRSLHTNASQPHSAEAAVLPSGHVAITTNKSETTGDEVCKLTVNENMSYRKQEESDISKDHISYLTRERRSPIEDNTDNLDDINEELKKEMEALDAEIKRKEKEQEEMRRKKMELLRRAKQAKAELQESNIEKDMCKKMENDKKVPNITSAISCNTGPEKQTEITQKTCEPQEGLDSVTVKPDAGLEQNGERIIISVTENIDASSVPDTGCESDGSDRDTPKLVVDESQFEVMEMDDKVPEKVETQLNTVNETTHESDTMQYTNEIIDFSIKKNSLSSSNLQGHIEEDHKTDKTEVQDDIRSIIDTSSLKVDDTSTVSYMTDIGSVNPFTGEYEKLDQTSLDLCVKSSLPVTTTLTSNSIATVDEQAKASIDKNIPDTIQPDQSLKETMVEQEQENRDVGSFLSSLDLSKKTSKFIKSPSGNTSNSGSNSAYDYDKIPSLPSVTIADIDASIKVNVNTAISKITIPILHTSSIELSKSKETIHPVITESLACNALIALKDDSAKFDKVDLKPVEDKPSSTEPGKIEASSEKEFTIADEDLRTIALSSSSTDTIDKCHQQDERQTNMKQDETVKSVNLCVNKDIEIVKDDIDIQQIVRLDPVEMDLTQEKVQKVTKSSEDHDPDISASHSVSSKDAGFERNQTIPSKSSFEHKHKSKVKYIELLPAHYNPSPKKASRGTTPVPAHEYHIDTKEVIRKHTKSMKEFKSCMHHSCPYIPRETGCFLHPIEVDIPLPKMWEKEKPCPAHVQKPFGIPGHLIVTLKKGSRKRKASEDVKTSMTASQGHGLRKSASSDKVASNLASTVAGNSHKINATPSTQSVTPEAKVRRVASMGLSLAPQRDISPVTAHCRPQVFIGNADLCMTQTLRPPAIPEKSRTSSTASVQDTMDVIDLTAEGSLRLGRRTTVINEHQAEAEKEIQQELSAALAKRQRQDMANQREWTSGGEGLASVNASATQGYRMNTNAPRQQPVHLAQHGRVPQFSRLPSPNVAPPVTSPHQHADRQYMRMPTHYPSRAYPEPVLPGQMAGPRAVSPQMSPGTMRYREMQQKSPSHRPGPGQITSHTRIPMNMQPINPSYRPMVPQQNALSARQMGAGQKGYHNQQMNPAMRQTDYHMNQSMEMRKHNAPVTFQQMSSAPSLMQPPMLLHSKQAQDLGYFRDKRRVQPQLRFPSQGLQGVDYGQVGEQRDMPMLMGHKPLQTHQTYKPPDNIGADEGMHRMKLYHNTQNAQHSPRTQPLYAGHQHQQEMHMPGSQQNPLQLHSLLQQKHPQFPISPQEETPGNHPPNLSFDDPAKIQKMKQIRAQFIKSQQRRQMPQVDNNSWHMGTENTQVSPPTSMRSLYMQKGPRTSVTTNNPLPLKPHSHNPPVYMSAQPTPTRAPPSYTQSYQPDGSTSLNQQATTSPVNPPQQRWIQPQAHHHQTSQPTQIPQPHEVITIPHSPVPPYPTASPQISPNFNPATKHHHQQQQQLQQQQQQHQQQQSPHLKQFQSFNSQGPGQIQQMANTSPAMASQPVCFQNQIYPNNSVMATGGHHRSPEVQITGMSQEHSVPAQKQVEEEVPHLQQIHGACIMCGKYSLYLCSNCKQIWYCSPECQLTHWQTHASECKGDGT